MCDLMPSVLRMTEKLCKISDIADKGIAEADASGRVGERYMTLSRSVGHVADLVKDLMLVRNYWYMKFCEEGLIKTSGARRADNVSAVPRGEGNEVT